MNDERLNALLCPQPTAMSMEGAAGQDIADAIRALIGSKP